MSTADDISDTMPGTVGNFLQKCQSMSGLASKRNGDQSDLLAVSARGGRAREGLWLSRSSLYAGCALVRLKCGFEDGGCTCLGAWMLRGRGAARLHQSGDHTNQPRHTPQTIRPSAPCRNQDKREVDSMHVPRISYHVYEVLHWMNAVYHIVQITGIPTGVPWRSPPRPPRALAIIVHCHGSS
jgi:hypothetical protein